MAYGEDAVLIARRVLKDLNTAANMLPKLVLLDDKKKVNKILEMFDHYLSESEDPNVKVLDYVTQSDYANFERYKIQTSNGDKYYFDALKELHNQGIPVTDIKEI